MAEVALLELGTEEIPASFVLPALEFLKTEFASRALAQRLGHGEILVFGTPRRLAILVHDVIARTEDINKEVLGPPVKAAFGPDGQATAAALKFAQSQGVAAEALTRKQTPKGEYVCALVRETGRPAGEILAEVFSAMVHGLKFEKSMRWGDVEQTFARPLHWIVALLGAEVVPVVFADVRSARSTWGHRFLSPGVISLSQASDYAKALERAHVIPDIAKRRARLMDAVASAAKEAGGVVRPDDALVDEVVQLVEWPCPLVGAFDERHLDLPAEVLIQEMRSHQRYFAVVDAKGALLPKFVVVSNTPVNDVALSRRGYERVLRARLADGRFFFDEDKKTPLESRVEKLDRVVWEGQLGTYGEKVVRLRALVAAWCSALNKPDWLAVADRAAQLAKADLVTGMVGEFPELQGVMGREYARAGGESPAVAQAIDEHYWPRFSGDRLPSSDAGALVGLADRLDTLCGLFAVGKVPSGTADPYGLRRACLAVVHVVLSRGYRLPLGRMVDDALAAFATKFSSAKTKLKPPEVRTQLLEFFRGRLVALWGDKHRGDVIEAVLAAGFEDLVGAEGRLVALERWMRQPDFAALAGAFKRVANIVDKQAAGVASAPVDPARCVEDAEKALHSATEATRSEVERALGVGDCARALGAMAGLRAPVDTFFEKVLVMAEDPAVRQNRIALLSSVRGLIARIADFSKLQAEAA
ncbi:MAG: glycine--tRNA ligase subunit beta [Myxococcaceae bacterium]